MTRIVKTEEQKLAAAAAKQAERIAKHDAKVAAVEAMKASVATAADMEQETTEEEEAALDLIATGEPVKKVRGRKPAAAPVEAPAAPEMPQGATGDTHDDASDDETGVGGDSGATDDDGDAGISTAGRMAQALKGARVNYRVTVTASGGRSADCGDGIARGLQGFTGREVADLADLVCGQPTGTHFRKYSHLNNGQIRMNSGNKIRGQYKKATEEGKLSRANEIREIVGLNAL
jgi:hypothetical protein